MKTMVMLAKEFLEKTGCEQPFNEIWAFVKKEYADQYMRERGHDISEQLETEDAIGDFYTDLILSQEITVLEGNIWNLAKRVKSADMIKSSIIDDDTNYSNKDDSDDSSEFNPDEEEDTVDEDEQSEVNGEQFNEEELFN